MRGKNKYHTKKNKPGASKLPVRSIIGNRSSVLEPMVPKSMPLLQGFESASGRASESMSTIHWRSTYFRSYSPILGNQGVLCEYVEPSTFLSLTYSETEVSRASQLSVIDRIRVKILPRYTQPSAALFEEFNPITAFGVLVGTTMLMPTPVSTETSLFERMLLGSQSTRLTTQTVPDWRNVFDFNMKSARDAGFLPDLQDEARDEESLWRIFDIALVDLLTGEPITSIPYDLQVTIHGTTMFQPNASAVRGGVYTGQFSDKVSASGTGQVVVTDLVSLGSGLS